MRDPSRQDPRRRPGRRRGARFLVVLLATLLGACGLVSGSAMTDNVRPGPKAGYPGRPLTGAQLTVTSKEFTEQIVLGQMMGIVFEAAGAKVIDKTSIQGSIGAREAVKSGTADAAYEYTGTGWITYLGHTKPIVDPQKQWKAVRDEDRKNGIVWLPASTLNNTYALALNSANWKKLGCATSRTSRRCPTRSRARSRCAWRTSSPPATTVCRAWRGRTACRCRRPMSAR